MMKKGRTMRMKSKDSDESQDDDDLLEDPEHERPGKYYLSKTQNSKVVAKILVHFCKLLQLDANAIVVYFYVSSQKKLADFQNEHWKDTFTQW